jgi:hypothetical protein
VDTDQRRGHRSGARTGRAGAAQLRVKTCMTRRDFLFTPETISHIHKFYDYHQDYISKSIFDDIINEPYHPKLKSHPRGFSEVIPQYEATLQDLEGNLGRVIWGLDDEKTIKLVKPDFRRFIYCEKDIIIYENDAAFVKGYENSPDHLHILLAKSKVSSLTTFKRFKQLLGEMRRKYDLITAHVAENPCRITGLQNDWRFEKNANRETRLLRYWRKMGFESCDKNRNVVKIKR